MNESRHWKSALVVTGLLCVTLQGHADDGGKPRGEPRREGSISKAVVQAGQKGANLLKPTAWLALEKGYGGVTGTIDANDALDLDIAFADGTELGAQVAGFRTATRVSSRVPAAEGFQVRDVAAGSDFVRIEKEAVGLSLDVSQTKQGRATFFDVTVRDTTGKDRAVTLVYAIPVPSAGVRWLDDPRRSSDVETGREYVHAAAFRAGANGRLSTYPLAALARAEDMGGLALAIDMAYPAFYRIGYSAGSGEFWIAYDLGLAPEKPTARLRFCRFDFAPDWGFRSALDMYYRLFPEAFRRRIDKQGLWMPFAKISKIKGWEDFGFRFKEGNDETAWDDAHASSRSTTPSP